MVTRGEIEYAVNNLNAMDLVDLRRRTVSVWAPVRVKCVPVVLPVLSAK